MISQKTQAAIAVLNDIHTRENPVRTNGFRLSEEDRDTLLSQLVSAGLIRLTDNGHPRDLQSYVLAHKSAEISLLDILEATGENLNCNHPATEAFYARYGRAAQKLGVVNLVTREYLKEIKLFEL